MFHEIPNNTRSESLARALLNLADEDRKRFAVAFRRIRKDHPIEAARICVRYLATSEWNDAGREILAWLVFRPEDIPPLLDQQLLSREEAHRAADVLAKSDPRI